MPNKKVPAFESDINKNTSVKYEFLSSSKERIITEKDLKKRYSCITRNPLIKFLLKTHLITI